MIWVHCEDIAANRLGFFRLVEVKIALSLRDGGADASLGNRFQLKFHRCPPTKASDGTLDRPKQICSGQRSQDCYSIAACKDNFVQMLDLQSVIQRVAKAVSEVEQGQ